MPRTIDYQHRLSQLLKEKNQYFFLGLIVILTIIFFLSSNLIKSKIINYSFSQFKKNNKTQEKKTDKNGQTIYQIKEGDDLWNIAEEYYGSGFNAYDIAQYNRITDPNNLERGRKIVLPKVSPKEATKGDISTISSQQVTSPGKTYVVQPGDDLCQIALKVYGDCLAAFRIIQANNILNPDVIEVGTILQIPR